MAQSRCIGLYGPFTNLPFWGCAMYFDYKVTGYIPPGKDRWLATPMNWDLSWPLTGQTTFWEVALCHLRTHHGNPLIVQPLDHPRGFPADCFLPTLNHLKITQTLRMHLFAPFLVWLGICSPKFRNETLKQTSLKPTPSLLVLVTLIQKTSPCNWVAILSINKNMPWF